MECRSCKFFFFVLFFIFTKVAFAACEDKKYIYWMKDIIEEEKEKIGGISSMIPTSLALAQSILETGYGKSYAAKKKNNYFGISYKGKTKKFNSPIESVRFYFKTLSFHSAYKNFRKVLKKGEDDPFVLIRFLAPVYAENPDYAKKIKLVIKSCNLQRFDI